jgi:hypothetical protein
MSAVERLLNEEVTRLLDRLATTVEGGCLAQVSTMNPALRRRLDEADAHLAAARASMLDDYGRWRRALEDMENLWALAAWRSAAEEAPEQATAVAA